MTSIETSGVPAPTRDQTPAPTSAPTSTPDPRTGHGGSPEPESQPDLQMIWVALQEALLRKVKPEQFETWFRRAALVELDTLHARIVVQNGFARDWLNSYYLEIIEACLTEVVGDKRRVELGVDAELTIAANTPRPEPTKPAPLPESPATKRVPHLLASSDIALNHRYTFDQFVVGPCNRFAHAASQGVSEAPGQNYNPFFLHGSVGLGKTHLLQSLCHSILNRDPSARILYLSCETFVNHFINALENGDLERFRNKYRNVDVLVVDDIHILANKERTQEEFFHTFNTLYNGGSQIVLSSDSPPKDIPTLQERLVSRFKWGLVTEIELPCYETRMAILKRKSKERGHELPDPVASLLAERIESNIRELEGAVTKLLGYASLSNRTVTPELAREVLSDIFVSRRGHPSMEDILRIVTEHFGVKVTDLQSRKRTNAVAYPRQIAMYLSRKITRHSLEEIGGYFGGRDHSTVLYAVDKITKLSTSDVTCRQALSDFLDKLQSN